MDRVEERKILRERARKLQVEQEKRTDEMIEVLTFMLAFEQYAIKSTEVYEVLPLKDITAVPCTPDFILGITNYRGNIIAINDLKIFFNLPKKGISHTGNVVVLKKDNFHMGLLVDEVTGLSSIPLKQIQVSIATLSGKRSAYLFGVSQSGLIVLDGEKIISDQTFMVEERV